MAAAVVINEDLVHGTTRPCVKRLEPGNGGRLCIARRVRLMAPPAACARAEHGTAVGNGALSLSADGA